MNIPTLHLKALGVESETDVNSLIAVDESSNVFGIIIEDDVESSPNAEILQARDGDPRRARMVADDQGGCREDGCAP